MSPMQTQVREASAGAATEEAEEKQTLVQRHVRPSGHAGCQATEDAEPQQSELKITLLLTKKNKPLTQSLPGSGIRKVAVTITKRASTNPCSPFVIFKEHFNSQISESNIQNNKGLSSVVLKDRKKKVVSFRILNRTKLIRHNSVVDCRSLRTEG